MDVFYRIVALLGGLALFLYGMQTMGDGLKNSSGGALKAALAKVTNKPVMGFILGALVTAMIQSSTATIVLTVGLVGAGFLTFNQSIGIILGANVGTAITAQVIRLMDVEADAGSILYFFKSDNLSSIALVLGIIMLMFIKKRSASAIGTICMGFGILFVGLVNMSSAVSTMSDSLSHLLVAFENNYFLGFLSGVGVTGVIQSSSAVVGILQSIASSVGVHFCGVFAVIIGVNIGDCITTFLVCRIGAKPEQIRACLIHIIYNVFAAILIFAAVLILHATGIMPEALWNLKLNSGGVANVHGLFRLVPAVLLLPFSGLFAQIANRMVPDKPIDSEDADIERNLRELDSRLIQNPGLALAESDHLIRHMSDVAFKNYTASVNQIFGFTEKRNGKIAHREDLLDRMTDAANQFVLNVTPHIVLDNDDHAQNFQLKALTAFERIGDRAVNINDSMFNLYSEQKAFSDPAKTDIKVLTSAVREILEVSIKSFKDHDASLARRIEPLEEVIDELVEALRNRHVQRMTQGICAALNGIEYENVLQNLGRVSDQCSDLGVYLLSMNDPSIRGNEHRYLHELHHSNNPEYMKNFSASYDKYFGMLNSIGQEALENAILPEEEIVEPAATSEDPLAVLEAQEVSKTEAAQAAEESKEDSQEPQA